MEEITKLIDDLQPQAARYDTPIADDLLICTFPNGVRTWIFTYTMNGFQRRRSIGVYPEMSLADARQALIAARKLQQVEDHLAQQGLAGEVIRQTPTDEEAAGVAGSQGPRRWLERRTVSAALAGALMSVALLLIARQFRPELFASAPQRAVAAAPSHGATTVAKESEPGASQPAATVVATTEHAGTDAAPAASATPTGELSEANRALLKAQESLRGSVAREVLARGIDGDQPVHPFESQLTLESDEAATLYYFTDVRGMAGKTVSHRWLYRGKLVSEVQLQVGAGWRSALHSSVTVTPGMTGHWEVFVCDAGGKPIEQESFELAATPQLSSR